MTVLVDRLERSGMAERIPHPTDRRRAIVQLTESGRDIVDRADRTLSFAFEHVPPRRRGGGDGSADVDRRRPA